MKRADDLGDALAALQARAHENPHRDPIGITPQERPAASPEGGREGQPTQEAEKPRSEPKNRPQPWDAADPRIPAHFTVRAKAPLHAKLVYVADHSLGRPTLHSIALEILEQGLNERLRAMGIQVK